ncbi:MAG: ABC transporter permease [Actinobacteria bacterium]|nr:ABC transporter permease [Actinomycetota bacterium]
MAGAVESAPKRGRFAPYGLLSPGIIWLTLFFLVPVAILLRAALSDQPERFVPSDLDFTWKWSNFSDGLDRFGPQFLDALRNALIAAAIVAAITVAVFVARRDLWHRIRVRLVGALVAAFFATYIITSTIDGWGDHFQRSFLYAGIATLLCIAIGYPLAYVIAFRGGTYKNLLLGLVVVPFFTTYLIRTIAWQTILFDEGPVVGFLQDVGLFGDSDRLLATPGAVIGGLTYNFLPFMILPIYVSLEKIDRSLVDAARDLYSTPARAFQKVVLPLSLPGVFAGTLLTFIPASGDFINAELLGSPTTSMIGNVVQNQFLVQLDYPTAAALSFVLMAIITIAVLVYAKVLGTEDLTG